MTDFRAPIPAEVRYAVLRRAEGCCERCGCARPVEMHHTTYRRYEVTGFVGDALEAVFGYETPDILLALCRDCHLSEHIVRGEFYRDPEEAAAERDWAA